jgi:serine/threonine protein phosphatase 1
MFLKRLFGKPPREPEPPPSTGGRVVYAVGDIHGRLDLLRLLWREVIDDAQKSGVSEAGRPLFVFLGDYVDRGPASRGVIDLILWMREDPRLEVAALKGNHEETLLRFIEDPVYGAVWVDHGGDATLASYGVTPPSADHDIDGWMAARDAFVAALPAKHTAFYRGLELMRIVGDYAFVHAGVRPGVPVERQTERDLLWIRQDFLQAPGPFGKVIVHGHTVTKEVQITPHRIGVDTGAYATGVLTAIRLEGQDQRLMQAKLPA